MATFIKIQCDYCKKEIDRYIGHVTRSKKMGYGLYCNQTCSGLHRRVSPEEKKKTKSEYDKKRRKLDWMPLYDAFLFHLDYAANPEKYRQIRIKRYPKHLEYLRRPEYKKYKKAYDEMYLAKKIYGEFSEAAIALKRLEEELESKQIKYDNGVTINKSVQKRKRRWTSLQVKISKPFSGQL